MTSESNLHIFIECVTGGVALAGFIITTMIKVAQNKVKSDLVERINVSDDAMQKHKEDLRLQIAHTDQIVAVHAARDDEKFEDINEKFTDIKTSLRTLTNRKSS